MTDADEDKKKKTYKKSEKKRKRTIMDEREKGEHGGGVSTQRLIYSSSLLPISQANFVKGGNSPGVDVDR